MNIRHLRFFACLAMLGGMLTTSHGQEANSGQVSKEPAAFDIMRFRRDLNAARAVGDWEVAEAISLEALDASTEPSPALEWLDAAAGARAALLLRQPSSDPTTSGQFAEAIYNDIITNWRRCGRSMDDFRHAVSGLRSSLDIAERAKRFDLIARWGERNGDLVAAMPEQMQQELPTSLLADVWYAHSAVATLREGDRTEAERILEKIDRLHVRFQTSSFHAIKLYDLIGETDRIEAFRFAQSWLKGHPSDQSYHLISRVAASATSVARGSSEKDKRDAMLLLDSLEAVHSVAIKAGDEQTALQHIRNVGLSRTIKPHEQETVSAQILLSRFYLAWELQDERRESLARAFLDRYPSHPAAPSVAAHIGHLTNPVSKGGSQ